MKIDDSGMPQEVYWNSLFDVASIVTWLQLESLAQPIVELGCGYGTFTVPIAQQVGETVYAFDIEPEMIQVAASNARSTNLRNVVFECRDFIEEGTGLCSADIGLVLAFNILHSSENVRILAEASRILSPKGKIAIIHWRKDVPTPRGPKVASRPDENTINDAIRGLDLCVHGDPAILRPYHWGIQLTKDCR